MEPGDFSVVHLARNNPGREVIAGFYSQTKEGGAKNKTRFKQKSRSNHKFIRLTWVVGGEGNTVNLLTSIVPLTS